MAALVAPHVSLAYCPQPPNQSATQCECSHNRTARPTHALPRCMATSFCGTKLGKQRVVESGVGAASSSGDTSFVIVYGFNRSQVRYWYRPDPERSFLNAMRLIVRLLLSLQATGSALPVHLLLSGERHAGFEAALTQQFPQLRLLNADTDGRHRIRVPRWASAFHWGSFAKLSVLALTQFRRIVVLDTDTVVLRKIDHLVRLPAPAFVYRFKCWSYRRSGAKANVPIWEMNSGVAVLRPDEALHARMQSLLNGNGTTARKDSEALKAVFTPSDPGDQSVWRHFFERVHELPVSYNTFKRTHFVSVHEWQKVHVLHDPDVHRAVKIPLPSVQAHYMNLTVTAQQRVKAIAASLGVRDRG